jgi:hypothetical protein
MLQDIREHLQNALPVIKMIITILQILTIQRQGFQQLVKVATQLLAGHRQLSIILFIRFQAITMKLAVMSVIPNLIINLNVLIATRKILMKNTIPAIQLIAGAVTARPTGIPDLIIVLQTFR